MFDVDCTVAESEFYQSGGTVVKQAFAISPNGNLYLTVSADPEGTWKHNIYRYNSETGALALFGGELGVTPTQRSLTPISFDNKNNPVVVSKEGDATSGGPVNLRVIDPATQQWSDPMPLSEKSPNIAVASDGKGGTFIAFPTALPDVVIGKNVSDNDVTVTPYEINIWSFALEEDEE